MNSIAVSSSSILALLTIVIVAGILLAFVLHQRYGKTGVCPGCGSGNRHVNSTDPGTYECTCISCGTHWKERA